MCDREERNLTFIKIDGLVAVLHLFYGAETLISFAIKRNFSNKDVKNGYNLPKNIYKSHVNCTKPLAKAKEMRYNNYGYRENDGSNTIMI